jgi:hypothetical protein
MAYKIWVALSSKQLVEIETCLPYYAVCYNLYTATAYAKVGFVSVNVDEYVEVLVEWYGDLGGYMNASVIITPGTNCASELMYADPVSCGGEYYSYSGVTLLYPDPPESATQIYSLGNTVTGTCSC